jgi:BASS family bile acid:Na+ symporter
MIGIYLGTSKASNFARTNFSESLDLIILIAISSLVLCIVNFVTGYLIGGKNYSREAKQSLGQKNNAFTIWISLEFLSPIILMGPVFYIFFQNIYISYQLFKSKTKDKSNK